MKIGRAMRAGLLAAGLVGLVGQAVGGAEEEGKAAGAGLYRHVVLFEFREGTPEEKVAEIEEAFAALPGKIDTVVDFEWGTDVSPEGLSGGFTHCFLVTFADRAGLDVYLPHPAHEAFVALLKPHLAKAVVVDYVAK